MYYFVQMLVNITEQLPVHLFGLSSQLYINLILLLTNVSE